MICKNCGCVLPESTVICPSCGTDQMTYEVMQPMEPAKPLGMKWYSFVIWVQLLLFALWNVVAGLKYLSGHAAGLEKEQWEYLYLRIDGLHTVINLLGIISLGTGIFALVVRHFLTQFKEKGPMLFLVYQILYIVFEFVGVIVISNFLGIPAFYMMDDFRFWLEIIWMIVLVILNTIYFHKRKDMFVF